MPLLPSYLDRFSCLQFPVICDPNRIAGLRADGQAFDLSTTDALNRVPTLAAVKTLCVRPRFSDVTITERRVLYERMPRLENLFIETIFNDPKDRGHYFYSPECTLHATNFPALRTLFVCAISIKLDLPICQHLRLLYLQLPRDEPPCLPLADFLEILRYSGQLEEVYVKNYINVSAPAGTPRLSLIDLHAHRQLKVFSLFAPPDDMPTTLSHLIIPASVNVRIVGYVTSNPHGAPRAMLPDNTRKLPLLHSATEIRARDAYDHECLLTASTDEARLDLELRSNEDGFGIGEKRDGTLIHAMLQSWDIFQGAPVKTADVVGNLEDITQASWVTAFDRFPGIEDLVVEDVHEDPVVSVQPLLLALVSQSHAHPGLACARLRSFKLTANIIGTQLLDLFHGYLKRRMQRGGQPLQRLHLVLYPDRMWSAASLTRARETLAPFAATLELDIKGAGTYTPGNRGRGRRSDM